MILKFRAVAVAAAAFAFAGSAFIGGPAQALQGPVALPPLSTFAHAPAPLGATTASALGLTDRAAPAPADARSLDFLVETEAAEQAGNTEQECLANAVYFEARGEPLQGQLAVAEVVMNRAASGRFPASLCGVVVQRAQFSFVHRGRMPHADRASEAWRRAVGIARVAVDRMAPRQVPANCLWYHANYVSPSWGRRLAQSARIGLHIFYS
jgi:spore germination cell wall hydrolase CwlJ-like protein